MCKDCLKSGIDKISRYIPDICLLLSQIIDTACWKQSHEDCNLLQQKCAADIGLWNTILFVDGRTELFHCENDCSYKYITVPRQHMNSKIHCSDETLFEFIIDSEKVLMLPFFDNIYIFLNASFLMHR